MELVEGPRYEVIRGNVGPAPISTGGKKRLTCDKKSSVDENYQHLSPEDEGKSKGDTSRNNFEEAKVEKAGGGRLKREQLR